MKSRFVTPLIIRNDSTDKGAKFVLMRPLIYESHKVSQLGVNASLVACEGFTTDFASIPRFLWRVLPPAGSAYDAPAVIHDLLYRQQAIQGRAITRAFADAVLNEAMTVKGVARWKRWTIIAGLRLGGWKVWNEYTGKKMRKRETHD